MKPLNAIFAIESLGRLAWAMIGIFIPIYLLTLGYELEDIAIFYILNSAAVFFSSLFAGFLITRIGLKKTLLAYLPFLALFIIMLYLVGRFAIPLWLIGVVAGLQTAFYFMPINILFARLADDRKMGDSVGKLNAYPMIASLGAPLLGGAVAVAGGFPALIVLSGCLFVVSAVPIFFLPDTNPKIEFNIRKIAFFFKKYPRFGIVQVFQFFQKTLEDVFWPIFIFLTFNNILSVGIVGALAGAGAGIFMIFVGRRADVVDKKKLIKTGAIFLAFIWICRFFIRDEIGCYVLTICAGFFGILMTIPFNAYTFNKAKKGNIAEFMIFREFLLLTGRLMALGLVILAAGRLDYTFIAAALSSLVFLLL